MGLHKTSYQQAVEAVKALSPSERERLFACFNEKPVATNDSVRLSTLRKVIDK